MRHRLNSLQVLMASDGRHLCRSPKDVVHGNELTTLQHQADFDDGST